MRGLRAIKTQNIKCEDLNGAYSELASILGVDAVLKIHDKYRGTQISFPVELFSREFIKAQIIEDYNGRNIKELASKFGYTEKWIRKILKDNADKY
ncbi:MAG: Mor transcription activator family protein [Ruminococcus sp.]|nr:Mor transcription activator family protein [Oscillospiraceae bacterium]MBR2724286.1 Mor transcription activator family protein [Ruminococcus sp.]